MKALKIISLICFLILMSSVVRSQRSNGSELINHYQLQDAIKVLKENVKDDKDDVVSWAQLGDCHWLNRNYSEAAHCFNEAILHGHKGEFVLRYYAQALLANGQYVEAKEMFGKYAEKFPGTSLSRAARNFATNCAILSQGQKNETNVIVNSASFNSTALDFSPAYYKKNDQIVFVSNREEDTKAFEALDPWTNGRFTNLFRVQLGKTPDRDGIPEPVKGKVNGDYHEGPVTFTTNGSTMYFTRTNYLNQLGLDRNQNARLQIFESKYQNGKWTELKSLPFNSDHYSSAHPTLSKDGKTMIFSSDRPGSKGGMDLWACERSGDSWGKPYHLGDSINGLGNEVFPFLADNDALYFSSDFHAKGGFGGLDIYEARHAEGGWTSIRHLTTPFNSQYDDFGYIVGPEGSTGFFSSNRDQLDGTFTDDNIYRFSLWPKDTFSGTVVDCKTGEPIEGAIVTISGRHYHTIEVSTDKNGEFQFMAHAGDSLVAEASKEQYFSPPGCDSKIGFLAGQETKLELGLSHGKGHDPKQPCDPKIVGVVYDAMYDKPVGGVKITFTNRQNGDDVTVYSNKEGKFELPHSEIRDYNVTVEKKNFFSPNTSYFFKNDNPCEINSIELYVHFLDPYELYHIYFDLDKYAIRPDAVPNLRKVAAYLEKFKDAKGKILAHTDSRNSNGYNDTLSDNRAKAAFEWLITTGGVAESQLDWEGMGENILKNGCQDGVECTEEEHQRNRRVEFILTHYKGEEIIRQVRSKETPNKGSGQ